MAESIYTQLEKGRVITPVDGKDFTHNLPADLFPTVEQFENPDKLIAWANDKGYTAKLIQKGLQKGIIEVRAAFKSCKKDDTWSEEYGQKNVDAMKWDTVDKPKTAMSDEDKAISILGKMSAEEIAEMLKKLGK